MFAAPHAPPRSAPCAVCAAPVPPGAPPLSMPASLRGERCAVAVCGRSACRRRAMTAPALVTCAECGRAVDTPSARAAGRCGTPECRAATLGREHARQRAAIAAEASVRLGAAARALRDADARVGPDARAEAPVVLLPSADPCGFPMFIPPRPPPPVRLPRRRGRAFRAHVRRVARLAFDTRASAPPPGASPPGAPPAPPAAGEAPFVGAACAACGGRCCRMGGERAYLTADTLRRWFAEHPGAGVRAAAAAYAAHLPAASLDGSCVYHTPGGCALPRALRSDTCNRYECDGLTELREAYAERAAHGRPLRRAFLAVVEEGEVGRGEWVAPLQSVSSP